jgi:hypothetical protein
MEVDAVVLREEALHHLVGAFPDSLSFAHPLFVMRPPRPAGALTIGADEVIQGSNRARGIESGALVGNH